MLRVGTELVAGLHGEGERGGGEAALLQEPPSVVEPLLAKPGQCSYFANAQGSVCVAGIHVAVLFPRQVVCLPAIGP